MGSKTVKCEGGGASPARRTGRPCSHLLGLRWKQGPLLPAPGGERAEGEEGPGIPGVKPRAGGGGGEGSSLPLPLFPPHIGVVVGGRVLPFCPPPNPFSEALEGGGPPQCCAPPPPPHQSC